MDELLTYLMDEMSVDYWYDEAILICTDILCVFSKNDWNLLAEKIPSFSDETNVRLAETLADLKTDDALACYKQLAQVNSVSVSFACIDALRTYKDILTDYEFIEFLVQKAKTIVSIVTPIAVSYTHLTLPTKLEV